MKKLFFILFTLAASLPGHSQNDWVNDYNNTNWMQVFVTKAINKKTDWLIEYQWRRTSGLKYWQQGLFRTAIQYKPYNNVSIAVGYAEAETFTYGDYPIAVNGTFPEHRIFEQLILKQSFNKLTVINRFRIEQRWLGRVKAGTNREIEGWNFLHRFRYQCRVQMPIWIKKDKQFYVAAADEIFIGAGKKVGVNIFDQNRIFLLMGYKLNKNISFETGYFNQTLQQGRRINNNTIMQRNNGITLTALLNL
jgi:hypothetical protein